MKSGVGAVGNPNSIPAPKEQEIPSYGDLIRMDEFREMVGSGMFTSDDGYGYYSRDAVTMGTNPVCLSELDTSYVYVVWFNR